MRFLASQHIRKTSEFLAVRSSGKRRECGPFAIQIHRRAHGEGTSLGEGRPRLGVIASRRIGNAVHRNRAKRLMREVFRLHQASLPSDTDVVMIARQSIGRYPFAELEHRFLHAIHRLLTPRQPRNPLS